MRAPFVLIHGSWHGGWAWQAVICTLAAQGRRAYAPTLPGHGPDTERAEVTHRACVDAVVAYIRQRDLHDIILAGHSFGGTVIQKAVEQLPERIQRLVFVDALVLADHQSVFDTLPGDLVAVFNQLAAASTDNTMLVPWDVWRDRFMQDAPEAVARAIWELLVPEPNGVNLEPLDLKRFYALEIPKSYTVLRQDYALPPRYFHPQMSARLGACTLLEMDGSHEVMFTRPAALAESLIAASAD